LKTPNFFFIKKKKTEIHVDKEGSEYVSKAKGRKKTAKREKKKSNGYYYRKKRKERLAPW